MLIISILARYSTKNDEFSAANVVLLKIFFDKMKIFRLANTN